MDRRHIGMPVLKDQQELFTLFPTQSFCCAKTIGYGVLVIPSIYIYIVGSCFRLFWGAFDWNGNEQISTRLEGVSLQLEFWDFCKGDPSYILYCHSTQYQQV